MIEEDLTEAGEVEVVLEAAGPVANIEIMAKILRDVEEVEADLQVNCY